MKKRAQEIECDPKEDLIIQLPAADDVLSEQGVFIFDEEFTSESCGKAIRFILTKNYQQEPVENIKLLLMSPGGDLSAAFALIDVMRGSKIPVHTIGLGQIASAALFVFMAGEPNYRIITENTSMMSHQFSWFLDGKAHELIAAGKEIKLMQNRVTAHIKQCTGMNNEDVQKFLLPSNDVYLDAKTAIKLKIADRIVKHFP